MDDLDRFHAALIAAATRGDWRTASDDLASLIGTVRQLRRELAEARAPRPADGTCHVCGAPVAHPARGRRRKYCAACVERLVHRTPALMSRKNGAEKS